MCPAVTVPSISLHFASNSSPRVTRIDRHTLLMVRRGCTAKAARRIAQGRIERIETFGDLVGLLPQKLHHDGKPVVLQPLGQRAYAQRRNGATLRIQDWNAHAGHSRDKPGIDVCPSELPHLIDLHTQPDLVEKAP